MMIDHNQNENPAAEGNGAYEKTETDTQPCAAVAPVSSFGVDVSNIRGEHTTKTKALFALERVIDRGRKAFLEAGIALAKIRDEGLYKEIYKTFDEYCRERWGWKRQRAYELIASADAVKSLPEECNQKITNENQAAELSKVEPEHREQVITTAVEQAEAQGKPLTARAIKEVAETVAPRKFPPPPPAPGRTIPPPPQYPRVIPNGTPEPPEQDAEVPEDKTGMPIPEAILPLWRKAESIQQMFLTPLSKMRGRIREIEEATYEHDRKFPESRAALDPDVKAFIGASFGAALEGLDKTYTAIKGALPYAVCPTCQGKLPETCGACHGKGFVSEYFFKTCAAEEFKQIRFLANSKRKTEGSR